MNSGLKIKIIVIYNRLNYVEIKLVISWDLKIIYELDET